MPFSSHTHGEIPPLDHVISLEEFFSQDDLTVSPDPVPVSFALSGSEQHTRLCSALDDERAGLLCAAVQWKQWVAGILQDFDSLANISSEHLMAVANVFLEQGRILQLKVWLRRILGKIPAAFPSVFESVVEGICELPKRTDTRHLQVFLEDAFQEMQRQKVTVLSPQAYAQLFRAYGLFQERFLLDSASAFAWYKRALTAHDYPMVYSDIIRLLKGVGSSEEALRFLEQGWCKTGSIECLEQLMQIDFQSGNVSAGLEKWHIVSRAKPGTPQRSSLIQRHEFPRDIAILQQEGVVSGEVMYDGALRTRLKDSMHVVIEQERQKNSKEPTPLLLAILQTQAIELTDAVGADNYIFSMLYMLQQGEVGLQKLGKYFVEYASDTAFVLAGDQPPEIEDLDMLDTRALLHMISVHVVAATNRFFSASDIPMFKNVMSIGYLLKDSEMVGHAQDRLLCLIKIQDQFANLGPAFSVFYRRHHAYAVKHADGEENLNLQLVQLLKEWIPLDPEIHVSLRIFLTLNVVSLMSDRNSTRDCIESLPPEELSEADCAEFGRFLVANRFFSESLAYLYRAGLQRPSVFIDFMKVLREESFDAATLCAKLSIQSEMTLYAMLQVVANDHVEMMRDAPKQFPHAITLLAEVLEFIGDFSGALKYFRQASELGDVVASRWVARYRFYRRGDLDADVVFEALYEQTHDPKDLLPIVLIACARGLRTKAKHFLALLAEADDDLFAHANIEYATSGSDQEKMEYLRTMKGVLQDIVNTVDASIIEALRDFIERRLSLLDGACASVSQCHEQLLLLSSYMLISRDIQLTIGYISEIKQFLIQGGEAAEGVRAFLSDQYDVLFQMRGNVDEHLDQWDDARILRKAFEMETNSIFSIFENHPYAYQLAHAIGELFRDAREDTESADEWFTKMRAIAGDFESREGEVASSTTGVHSNMFH